MKNLADLYKDGKGCENNIEKANNLYKNFFEINKKLADLNISEGLCFSS